MYQQLIWDLSNLGNGRLYGEFRLVLFDGEKNLGRKYFRVMLDIFEPSLVLEHEGTGKKIITINGIPSAEISGLESWARDLMSKMIKSYNRTYSSLPIGMAMGAVMGADIESEEIQEILLGLISTSS